MEPLSTLIILISMLSLVISVASIVLSIRTYGKQSAIEVERKIMDKFQNYVAMNQVKTVEPEKPKRPYIRKSIEKKK
jgi:hypothetical protein